MTYGMSFFSSGIVSCSLAGEYQMIPSTHCSMHWVRFFFSNSQLLLLIFSKIPYPCSRRRFSSRERKCAWSDWQISGISTPISLLFVFFRLRAFASGRYDNWLIALSTRSISSALDVFPFKTLETVPMETPASFATSFMVAIKSPPS